MKEESPKDYNCSIIKCRRILHLLFGWFNRNVSCYAGTAPPPSPGGSSGARAAGPCGDRSGGNPAGRGTATTLESPALFVFLEKEGRSRGNIPPPFLPRESSIQSITAVLLSGPFHVCRCGGSCQQPRSSCSLVFRTSTINLQYFLCTSLVHWCN